MSDRTNKVLVFSLAQVITLVINFFVSPYLSRALPKSEYSAFNQVIVIIGLAAVLFSFGIQSVVFLFFSRKDPEQRQTISTIQFFILCLGALSALCLWLFTYAASGLFDNPQIPGYLRACAPAVFFTFLNNYLISVLVFNSRTKQVAFLAVTTSFFTVTFLYLSLNRWHSVSLALFFSQVAAPLLSLLTAFFLARRFLLLQIRPDWPSVLRIFKVSGPLYITSLLGSSYLYFSAFFVIFILGDINYANYRNGAVEIPFISTVAFSVSAILLPDLNKYFHEGNLAAALELKKKIINQCIFLLYPVIVFFIVYHYEFIVSYFSMKYAESAIVFAIYSCTCFIRINDYQDVLITAGKSAYILKANIIYFLTNIASVVLLGLLFGIKGVAVAASLSVFVLAYILLRKDAAIFGVNLLTFFKLKPIFVLLGVTFGFSFLLKYGLYWVFPANHLWLFLTAAMLYFPVVYIFILRQGYIIPSVVDIVRKKLPFFSFLIQTKQT
ncbi:MAG: oligosaccharide flippase family protein [Sphingobacteriales bacterium]|nr:oligosaccharide flippase family protein [Sphingobacteriales bacterium]